MSLQLTQHEAQIVSDVLALVLNDPDWQDMAAATDEEWTRLHDAHAKILGATA